MQVFAALSTAALVYARWFSMQGRHPLARGSALVGALVPAGIVVFGRAQGREDRLGQAAGLIQQLTIALGWGWLLVLAADGLSNRLRNGELRPLACRPLHQRRDPLLDLRRQLEHRERVRPHRAVI